MTTEVKNESIPQNVLTRQQKTVTLILIGFIANLFIKEMPLRKQHDFSGPADQK